MWVVWTLQVTLRSNPSGYKKIGIMDDTAEQSFDGTSYDKFYSATRKRHNRGEGLSQPASSRESPKHSCQFIAIMK